MGMNFIGTAGSVLQSWLIVPLQYQSDLFNSDPFDDATVGLAKIMESVGLLLEVVIILVGAVVLVRLVLTMMSGDKDSAKKLLWWVAGLAGGLAILETLF